MVFKSTNEQINEIIKTINSKLKNHEIKIDRKFLCTGIISTRNNKELSIFDMDYMDSDGRLWLLKILNNDIELFEEKLNIIHDLHDVNNTFEPMNDTSVNNLDITRIKHYSEHLLNPEECNNGWQIEQIARFEIKHKGKNKLDIHAVIELTNHAAEFIKEVEKEINGKTFAVTRNIKTDSWHLAMSNIYEITVCDIDLNDIVATIQELSEITLDDFRTTH